MDKNALALYKKAILILGICYGEYLDKKRNFYNISN